MIEDLNAPVGEQPNVPGETIATEMPSLVPSENPPPSEVEAESEGAAEAEAETSDAEAEVSAETKTETSPKPDKLDWREKRRIEETNKRRATEAENARLKAEIEALRNPKPNDSAAAVSPTAQTPEQIRAAAVAEAKAEIAAEQARTSFAEATGRVLQAGIASIPDFEQARAEMVTNFGEQLQARPDFFEAIVDLENGHEVFYQLAKDPEQTEQLLSLPPVKMALKIAQLSSTTKAKAPEPKPISKAPAPVKPVGGVPQSSIRLEDESVPMDAWASEYLKRMAGKGR